MSALSAQYRLWLLLALLVLPGCELVRYHPYEDRFYGPRGLTQANVERIEAATRGKEQVRMAFISDTQRHYDDTRDAVHYLNSRGDIDLVMHGGDLVDFGLTDEFVWMRDILLGLRMPWLTAIGNHDFLGTGEYIYSEMFGAYNYGFTMGHTRVEVLNTSALEADYDCPVPDVVFLHSEVAHIEAINRATPDSITQTVLMMHARPGDEQFNNTAIEVFRHYLGLLPQVRFALCGHNHHNETLYPLGEDLPFHQVADIHKRAILIITLSPQSYQYEYVTF